MAIVYGPYGASQYYLVHTPEVWTNEEDRKDFNRISSVFEEKQAPRAFRLILSYCHIFFGNLLVVYICFSMIMLLIVLTSTIFELRWTSTWMLHHNAVPWTLLASATIVFVVAIPFTIKDKKKFEKDKLANSAWIKDLHASGKADELVRKALERIENLKSVRVVADGLSEKELEEWRLDITKIYSFDILDKQAKSMQEIQKWLETLND